MAYLMAFGNGEEGVALWVLRLVPHKRLYVGEVGGKLAIRPDEPFEGFAATILGHSAGLRSHYYLFRENRVPPASRIPLLCGTSKVEGLVELEDRVEVNVGGQRFWFSAEELPQRIPEGSEERSSLQGLCGCCRRRLSEIQEALVRCGRCGRVSCLSCWQDSQACPALQECGAPAGEIRERLSWFPQYDG